MHIDSDVFIPIPRQNYDPFYVLNHGATIIYNRYISVEYASLEILMAR